MQLHDVTQSCRLCWGFARMQSIDLYCERTDSGLWAEPVNAMTNLAFFLAAWWLWREAQRLDRLNPGTMALLSLMSAFGIGSLLFHTLANSVTRLLDVLPIALFVVTYLWLYARWVLKLGLAPTAALAATFIIAAYIGRQFPQTLNGSLIYAPAIVLLLGLSVAHWAKEKRGLSLLLGATGAFVMALVFRTIDHVVCPQFPLGTHFLWHVSTAIALVLATRALLANMPENQKRQSASTSLETLA